MEGHLTAKQVAEILNVSRPTAARVMIRAGATDIGSGAYKTLRITETALNVYLNARKAEDPPTLPLREVIENKKTRFPWAKKDYPGLQRR